LRLAVANHHQNIAEFDDVAGLAGNFFDVEDIVWRNAILLAARPNDSVHFFLPYPYASIGAGVNPRTFTGFGITRRW